MPTQMRILTYCSSRTRKGILLLAALCALFLSPGPVFAGEKIAVLISSPEQPFAQALKGFQDYFKQQGVDAVYEVHQLGGDHANAAHTVQKIRAGGAQLVLTIGSLATESLVLKITDIPVVACLVLRLDILKQSQNATGVGLEFPLDIQFAWLRALIPEALNIGVLYNPAENRHRIEEASRVASGKGLNLVALEVRTPQDLPAALNTLSRQADVLLSVPDSVALAPQMAKPLLLFSFRNSIPLVGLSSSWVKAGALYSLEWDYADLGAQAGEMALGILRGAKPNTIPTAPPRKTFYTLNLKTAEQMKIQFSDEQKARARALY